MRQSSSILLFVVFIALIGFTSVNAIHPVELVTPRADSPVPSVTITLEWISGQLASSYEIDADNTTCTVLAPTDMSVTVYPINTLLGIYGLRWSTNCNSEAPLGPPLVTSGTAELGMWEGFIFTILVDLNTPYTASFYNDRFCSYPLKFQEIAIIPNMCSPFYQSYLYPTFQAYTLFTLDVNSTFTLDVYYDEDCTKLDRKTQFNVTGTVGLCGTSDGVHGAYISINE